VGGLQFLQRSLGLPVKTGILDRVCDLTGHDLQDSDVFLTEGGFLRGLDGQCSDGLTSADKR